MRSSMRSSMKHSMRHSKLHVGHREQYHCKGGERS